MEAYTALADASPLFIILTFIGLLVSGTIVLGRELKAAMKRAEEFRIERDEWRTIAVEGLRANVVIARNLPEGRGVV